MLLINDGVIAITRGDDAVLEVAIHTSEGVDYAMAEGDVLTLTVRELPSEHQPVLLRVPGAPGSCRLVLHGADTAGIAPGKYSCDIQLDCQAGGRYTVLPAPGDGLESAGIRNFENFVVLPEVTVP